MILGYMKKNSTMKLINHDKQKINPEQKKLGEIKHQKITLKQKAESIYDDQECIELDNKTSEILQATE